VVDGDDVEALLRFVDAVDDAKVAAPGAVQTGQLQSKWLADSMWILRHGAVGEFDDGVAHLIRWPS